MILKKISVAIFVAIVLSLPSCMHQIPYPKQIQAYDGEPFVFGYKSWWITVKGDDNAKVAEVLKMVVEGNGYPEMYYISSSKDGWLFIVSEEAPSLEKAKKLLTGLSKDGGDAQFFMSYRITETHAWARALNGEMKRMYAFVGESLENTCAEGVPIGVEAEYNLINTLSDEAGKDDYYDKEEIILPSEDMVMDIAADWSLSPIDFTDADFANLWEAALVIKNTL